MKICALIPSYNEVKTIGSLVETIKAQGLDVIVVDDGSVDETSEVARRSGAYVLRHEQNKGKGASLKEGFRYIISKDYDAVITMDGDGQHSPKDIPKFIQAARDINIDMVTGNRMIVCGNMPPIRWFTNNLMTLTISLICRKKVIDSQCGFRLIKRKVFENLTFSTAKYEIESETLIETYRKGFKIKPIPIQTIYSQEVSRINPLVDALRSLRLALKIFCPFLFNKR
ncbi:MAG: glycosyltransferase family 2 protein [Candidatus Omnitrophica bacterium]|nr:glycosyltransferase family 2 protein [Candidatus Omnitrophota bacterium]